MIRWKSLRVRLWLWALLLVVAIGAVPVARWSAAMTAKRERSDIERLKIADPEQVCFRNQPTGEQLHWRWQFYLPPGRKFELHAVTGSITGEPGLPELTEDRRQYEVPLQQAGEFAIDVALQKGAEGHWDLAVQGPGFATTRRLEEQDSHWLDLVKNTDGKNPDVYGYSQSFPEQPPADFTTPPVLLRLRADAIYTKATRAMIYAAPTTPCDGLLLWIAAPGAGTDSGT